MAYLNQSDHTTILDSHFRYGKVLEVYEAGEADVELLDGNFQPSGEYLYRLPLFYHCYPDAQLQSNGSLENAYRAFKVNDVAIVKFEGADSKIVGIKGQLRSCYPPHALIFHGGNSAYLYEMDGKAWEGTLEAKNPHLWGNCDDVAFLGREYYVLDSDVVKYCDKAAWYGTRDQANEQECTGLPSEGITSISVIRSGNYVYLTATLSEQAVIKRYRTSDFIHFTEVSSNSVNDGMRGVAGYSTPVACIGANWVRWPTDRLAVTEHVRDKEPNWYPVRYWRMYRICIPSRWTAEGDENTTEEAITLIASSQSENQFTFNKESNFTVEGGFDGKQITQVF